MGWEKGFLLRGQYFWQALQKEALSKLGGVVVVHEGTDFQKSPC